MKNIFIEWVGELRLSPTSTLLMVAIDRDKRTTLQIKSVVQEIELSGLLQRIQGKFPIGIQR